MYFVFLFLNTFGLFGFIALIFTIFYLLSIVFFENNFAAAVLPLFIGFIAWFIFSLISSFVFCVILIFLMKPKKIEVIPLIGLIFYCLAFFALIALA